MSEIPPLDGHERATLSAEEREVLESHTSLRRPWRCTRRAALEAGWLLHREWAALTAREESQGEIDDREWTLRWDHRQRRHYIDGPSDGRQMEGLVVVPKSRVAAREEPPDETNEDLQMRVLREADRRRPESDVIRKARLRTDEVREAGEEALAAREDTERRREEKR